jgi:DNA-binding MarR family transcriptional regulator
MVGNKIILSKFLPYQLSITSNAISDLIARSYHGRFGLKIPEWRVLAVLAEQGAATQRDLSHATQMDKVTVNRACAAMVERGLVARAPNAADGRSHHLAMTALGDELYTQIVPLALSVEEELEKALDADEAAIIVQIMAKLRARVTDLEGEFM